jgi:hypothetical protein
MSNKFLETILYLLIIIALLGVGFYFGRTTVKVKTKIEVEYIKGDTIKDTLYFPKPYKIIQPIDTLSVIQQCIKDGIYQELWPEKTITKYIEITKEDTTKIMNDWASKRFYDEVLFNNDTIGMCRVKGEVQYNRLQLLGYEYEPITKNINETQYKVKLVSPFVGGGLMTNPWDKQRNPMINLTGGIFIKEKIGLQVNFTHGLSSKEDYIGGNILYKF